MDFRADKLDLKRQHDLGLLALVFAMEGQEGKADHLRAIARARYEAAVGTEMEKQAVTA